MQRKQPLSNLINKEINNGEFEFPDKQEWRGYTGYKSLKQSAAGRQTLRKRGYVVDKRIGNSQFVSKQFIAWDGEGITHNSRHLYIILAASTGDYLMSSGSSAPYGLSTMECFELLLDVSSRYPGAYHVIYGGSYDANKILKDLIYSEQRLHNLWKNTHCHYEQYFIEWIKGKWLRVKDRSDGRSIILYDVISFFQKPFVKTLEDWGIHVPHLEKMADMKDKRSEFKWKDRKQILAYCQTELVALVNLMSQFRDNHIAAGLPNLSGLYGPGSIANSLLNRYGIKHHLIVTDAELNLGSRYAYAAGRIERLRYGNYEGPVRIYDRHSAYPYTISQLPSLANAGWTLYRGACDPYPMSLYHVRLFNHEQYASPLFYRKGLAKSRPIFFPNPKGNNYIETWIWTPEYKNLVELGIPHQCLEAYIFNGNVNSRPFAWVEELYYQRKEWVALGNPAEKNLKLAINSLYGKFVQQAGYGRKNQIPKFHQLEWGGYITSDTRAELYRAIASINFRNVIGMETDSIIIAGNHRPKIPLSDKLGEWGVTNYDGITYIQSGVYWLKTKDGWLDKYSKRRGYLPGTLHRNSVIRAWNSNPTGDATYQKDGCAIGVTVNAKGRDFITIGHCFRPGQDFSNWGEWVEGPKKLSLWRSTKRDIIRGKNPATGLLNTVDNTNFAGWSMPYTLEWEEESYEDYCLETTGNL